VFQKKGGGAERGSKVCLQIEFVDVNAEIKQFYNYNFISYKKKIYGRNYWIKEDYCDNHSDISTILSVIKDCGLIPCITVFNIS